MSRHARYTLSDLPQYVIQRGHNNEHIFLEENDYLYYADCLQDACIQSGCVVHVYAFFHNHVHLLITQQTPNGIARLFQSLGRRYVRYFNDRHGRSGTLWEGRYKACLVQSTHYLMVCHRYIELYSVRNGVAKTAEAYRWSSASSYLQGTSNKLIKRHHVFFSLADNAEKRQRIYRQFLMQGVSKGEAELISSEINRCGVLGDDVFIFEMEHKLGWRVRPGKPGRPSTNKLVKKKLAV